MKDITVLLVDYTEQKMLQRAFLSLYKIKDRIKTVLVLHHPNRTVINKEFVTFLNSIQTVVIQNNDVGMTLNNTLDKIDTSYTMFLKDREYLSSVVKPSFLVLDHSKSVMTFDSRVRNTAIYHPFFVKTSLFKSKNFLSVNQLPFKDALFPSWLSTVEQEYISSIKGEWIKQAKKNTSTNQVKKQEFLKKYKNITLPLNDSTISVLISNYNMERYVETAIISCFFQQVQPDQVLIIDDGSTDNSYQHLEKWKEHELVYLFQKENEGKAKALNDVLTHVETDFVMELDADDWLDPDAISTIKNKLTILSEDISLLYGNFRRWKQLSTDDVMFKGIAKGKPVNNRSELLSYNFPLGPRIYRTTSLKNAGGFPVSVFEEGRLYEDVSVLLELIKTSAFSYQNFTVYNIRDHDESITQKNHSKWNDFIKTIKQ